MTTQVEHAKQQFETNFNLKAQEIENLKFSTSKTIADLNASVDRTKREKDQFKSLLEKDKESKDLEISTLKKKINSLEKTGLNTKKMNELKQSYNERILSEIYLYIVFIISIRASLMR